MALQPFGPWTLFQFLNPIRSRYGPLDEASALCNTVTYTQNKCTHTSMPKLGFELTTPVFERWKTVHALDRATTVIDIQILLV
jgi:hypothetical protein